MAGNNLLLAKILKDSNTTKGGTNALAEQFPQLYGALQGLLGTAPDEVGGSVLDGSHQAQSAGANVGFPLGLLGQMLPAAKLTKGLPVGMSIKSVDGPLSKFVYPQEQALLTAQRNAALPVEQGGLGLHPNNTPMERAQAMGFDTEAFHGTPDDRLGRSRQFKDSMLGKTTQVEDAKMGHFTVNDGNAASEYIWRDGSTDGGNVLPLQLAGDRASVSLPGEWMPGRFDNVIQQSKRGGYDGLTIKGTTTLGKPGDYQVTFDPKNIRSRFAAFDPMRRDSPDILAGLLPLSSMVDQDTRNKLAGLLHP